MISSVVSGISVLLIVPIPLWASPGMMLYSLGKGPKFPTVLPHFRYQIRKSNEGSPVRTPDTVHASQCSPVLRLSVPPSSYAAPPSSFKKQIIFSLNPRFGPYRLIHAPVHRISIELSIALCCGQLCGNPVVWRPIGGRGFFLGRFLSPVWQRSFERFPIGRPHR